MSAVRCALPNGAGVRLEAIDALRGAAALAVVLDHAFFLYGQNGAYSGLLEPIFWLGSTGVWLFIVISGFCIHLRFAKTLAQGQPEPPVFVTFWKRRLRRLYPAYFAALLLYAVLRLCDGTLVVDRFFAYDFTLHVLLIHNLDPATVFGFCGVFWTLALEEHLYLAYFLLIHLRMRWGWARTLAVCLAVRAVGLFAHWGLKRFFGWESAFQSLFVAQWFVWALGAMSVEAHLGVITLPRWCRDRRVAGGVLVVAAFLVAIERGEYWSPLVGKLWWTLRDPMLGLGFFLLVNSLVLGAKLQSTGALSVQKAFAALGVFSYSLYLVHQAVQLNSVPLILAALGIAIHTWMAPFVVAFSILFAWAFFNAFERPFLGQPAKA